MFPGPVYAHILYPHRWCQPFQPWGLGWPLPVFPPKLSAYLIPEPTRPLCPGGKLSNRAEQGCSNRRVSWCSTLKKATCCCFQAKFTVLAILYWLQQLSGKIVHEEDIPERLCQRDSLFVLCETTENHWNLSLSWYCKHLKLSVFLFSIIHRCIYRAAVTAALNTGQIIFTLFPL